MKSRRMAFTNSVTVFVLIFAGTFADAESAKLSPRLNLRRPTSVTATGVDIRRIAPERPRDFFFRESLVTPTSNGDLNSVGQDWMIRQTSVLTEGADQKLVADINRSMGRWLRWEDVQGEPWPDPDSSGEDSGTSGGSEGDGGRLFLKPKSMRFAQVNKIVIDWSHDVSLTCAATGGTMLVNITKPIGASTFVDLEHNSSRGTSSLHFNFTW
jgi:hypothetical protein